MKTYVGMINVVLNDNYEEAERFNILSPAIARYEQIKSHIFDDMAEENVYESGERTINEGHDTLVLEFVYKTCQDDEFEMIHPASIAII